MDMTMEKLNANREAICAEWMKRVEAREIPNLNATGPIITKSWNLWMIVREGDVRVYDLRIDAAGTITEEWGDGRVVEV